jgi:hypothetical protein
LTDVARLVIALLDGAHSRRAVTDAVEQEIQSKSDVDGILRHLHHHALLVA